MSVFIISVVTKQDIYRQAVEDNPHLTEYNKTVFDNTRENLPIPARYNDFIEHNMPKDAWLIFCHQDFEFQQDPGEIVKNLDKNCIYGPIGVTSKISKQWHLIFREDRKLRPSIRTRKNMHSICLGQILHGPRPTPNFVGKRISKPAPVDTVDCCCLMVHSSLIQSANLRFDERFDFHLYVEDFCLAAKEKGIITKAVQCKCYHYSRGNINKLFWVKYEELAHKYPASLFFTTCVSNLKQLIKAHIHHPLVRQFIDEYDTSI
uniref:Uncharacterized protein n=1 Tax=uncultured Elusimicrobia bacterium TaxID=699876 RepID=A0A650EMM5_9BACT|nr:hypothetical protein Elusimicrob1349_1620 [uncultured Elusimicrobia bacterium]